MEIYKLGNEADEAAQFQFHSGNICFEFSLRFLCTAGNPWFQLKYGRNMAEYMKSPKLDGLHRQCNMYFIAQMHQGTIVQCTHLLSNPAHLLDPSSHLVPSVFKSREFECLTISQRAEKETSEYFYISELFGKFAESFVANYSLPPARSYYTHALANLLC